MRHSCRSRTSGNLRHRAPPRRRIDALTGLATAEGRKLARCHRSVDPVVSVVQAIRRFVPFVGFCRIRPHLPGHRCRSVRIGGQCFRSTLSGSFRATAQRRHGRRTGLAQPWDRPWRAWRRESFARRLGREKDGREYFRSIDPFSRDGATLRPRAQPEGMNEADRCAPRAPRLRVRPDRGRWPKGRTRRRRGRGGRIDALTGLATEEGRELACHHGSVDSVGSATP